MLATPATRPQLNDIVIQGCLYSIDEGSATKRMTIGFGSGASEESGKDTIQGRVDATAKEIADQLHARFQAQGWVN